MPLKRLWPSTESSPLNLDTLRIDEHLGHLQGGSGGVFVFKTQDGERYTLKTNVSAEALKEEALADALYLQTGIKVPKFSLYQARYAELPAEIQRYIKAPANAEELILFRLADYIEPNPTLSLDEQNDTPQAEMIITKELPAGFVMDCFLGNVDVAGHWGNVLIDSQEQLWRIDNGSTLRFRARGEAKMSHSVVTELSTMKKETSMMKKVFGSIPTIEVQKQTKELLAQKDEIIQLFLDLHQQVHFDKPEVLLQLLINRMQYLHEHVNAQLHPYAPEHSEASVGYTSAGVLIVREIEGEPCILLARSSFDDDWSYVGGKSQVQEQFLSDTAINRSNARLGAAYTIMPTELSEASSHDLITDIEKTRLYFVKKEHSPSVELDTENMWWAPVKYLVGPEAVEGIELSYPLELLLQQNDVVSTIEQLSNSSIAPPKSHTRSRHSITYPTISSTSVPTHADIITPMAERFMLAETTANRGLMHRELLKKTNQTEHQTAEGPPQSDIHFKALFGEAFSEEMTEKEKVEHFLTKHEELEVTVSEEQKEQFVTMLQEEKQHPDMAVFYHAAQAEIGFLYDLFTEFRKQLEYQYADNTKVLRGLDDQFAKFDNVIAFLAKYNGPNGVNNYDEGYQEVGLSVNPFLFGSHMDSDSATYRFFLENSSIKPPDVEHMFNHFMAALGLSSRFADFKPIFNQFLAHHGGICYQLFIDSASVNEVAYPAAPLGKVNALGPKKEFTEVLESLEQEPAQNENYIIDLQARLYLKPEVLHDPNKVAIKSYHATPMSAEQEAAYHQELSNSVKSQVIQLLKQNNRIPEEHFASGTPGLKKQMHMVYQDRSRLPVREEISIPEEMIRLYGTENKEGILKLLKENPEINLFAPQEHTKEYINLMSLMLTKPLLTMEIYKELQKEHANINIIKQLKIFSFYPYFATLPEEQITHNFLLLGNLAKSEQFLEKFGTLLLANVQKLARVSDLILSLRSLAPKLETPENVAMLLTIAPNYDDTVSFALEQAKNTPSLLNEHSRKLLIKAPSQANQIIAALMILHNASPNLINEHSCALLSVDIQRVRAMATLLAGLYKNNPSLVSPEHIALLIKYHDRAKKVAAILQKHADSSSEQLIELIEKEETQAFEIFHKSRNTPTASPSSNPGWEVLALVKAMSQLEQLSPSLVQNKSIITFLNDEESQLSSRLQIVTDLFNKKAELVTLENLRFLSRITVDDKAQILMELYDIDSRLITDNVRELMLNHSLSIPLLLSTSHMLKEINPVLLAPEHFKHIVNVLEHQSEEEQPQVIKTMTETLISLQKINPALVNSHIFELSLTSPDKAKQILECCQELQKHSPANHRPNFFNQGNTQRNSNLRQVVKEIMFSMVDNKAIDVSTQTLEEQEKTQLQKIIEKYPLLNIKINSDLPQESPLTP